MQHNPGPLAVNNPMANSGYALPKPDRRHRLIHVPHCNTVACVYEPPGSGKYVYDIDRLALEFAAAPDMLKALKVAERQLRDSHDGKRPDDQSISAAHEIVCAAIAKAEGRC